NAASQRVQEVGVRQPSVGDKLPQAVRDVVPRRPGVDVWPLLGQLLPQDTAVVWKINVKQLLDSELVKKHALKQIKNSLIANADVQKAFEALGFDPLRDVSAVIGAHADLDFTKSLFIVQGRFDSDRLRILAPVLAQTKPDRLKIHSIGDHSVY